MNLLLPLSIETLCCGEDTALRAIGEPMYAHPEVKTTDRFWIYITWQCMVIEAHQGHGWTTTDDPQWYQWFDEHEANRRRPLRLQDHFVDPWMVVEWKMRQRR